MNAPVAVVTGASRGIGRAIAQHLATDGAYIVLNYQRDTAAAEETLAQVRATGSDGELAQFDVADSEQCTAVLAPVLKRLGRCDILVNNAGLSIEGLVMRFKPQDWDAVMAVNVRGAFNCTKLVLRPMLRARHGRIVNLTSVSAQLGNAGQAAYAAAKAGVIGLTKSTAREVASRHITVNAISPGFIATDMTAHLPETTREEYVSHIPLGRLGTVDEVAALVTFLTQPQAGYITGQVIGINGGLYM